MSDPVQHYRCAYRDTLSRISLVLVCLFVSACSVLRDGDASTWPEELPPAAYFVSAYEEDEQLHKYQSVQDYLAWIRGFYEGTTLYPRGWIDLSADILAQTEGSGQQYATEYELSLLGRDIGAEWAKDNSIRRVDNRHLAIWVSATQRAVNEGNVDETLEQISMDLEALLLLELAPDAITADRYHAPDADDGFAL